MSSEKSWTWTAVDAAFAARLSDKLPARCFDAHAHCYRLVDLAKPHGDLVAAGPAEVDIAAWRGRTARQLPGCALEGGLLFPMPGKNVAMAAANRFLARQLDANPDCRGLMLVSPEMSESSARALLDEGAFVGFKPYHLMGTYQPSFNAPISAYLPNWAWEIADARGLCIMLHIVREGALADPLNQEEIRSYCRRYPGAQLILAHAARGFNARNTVAGIASLAGLENVWFDSSGVCEPDALVAILRQFGPRKLMWGSDFPISELRGKCVTVGDGFSWIAPTTVDASNAAAPPVRCLPVGLESIQALLTAIDTCGLLPADVQDIFADNARRLLGLEPPRTVNQDLYVRARRLIPGGGHLLSKRPELMAPGHWPPYFREARGCEVWDLDGRHYYDFSHNAVGACLLGVAHPQVTRAVLRRVQLGNISSLNPPEEVELAEQLVQAHPWAEQVRFARTGGEIAAVAVRIARATTGRSVVAVCGYHGWTDWYLAANLGTTDSLNGHLLAGLDPCGVPAELRGTTHTFRFDSLADLEAICQAHGHRLAAVVMEPCRYHDPAPSFLAQVKTLTNDHGAILIFDEITVGWRRCYGGAHLLYDTFPDMALFGKALGNGHAISAVVGTRAAMAGAASSFISSSYWTESTGHAAALATLQVMREVEVPARVDAAGKAIQAALSGAAAEHGLRVKIHGFPCVTTLAFDHGELSQALRTLYTRYMLTEGFLAGPGIYPTLAHTDAVIDLYHDALQRVMGRLAATLNAGQVLAEVGPDIAHASFQRLN